MQYTPEEQAEHRKLWVEALRSGKYKQGRHVLRDTKGLMCCLGVACDISGLVEWTAEPHATGLLPTINGDRLGPFYTPKPVQDWLGLASYQGKFGEDQQLAKLNDDGASFADIAEIIASEPVGLVVQTEAA